MSKLTKQDIEQWDAELDAIEGLADQTQEIKDYQEALESSEYDDR